MAQLQIGNENKSEILKVLQEAAKKLQNTTPLSNREAQLISNQLIMGCPENVNVPVKFDSSLGTVIAAISKMDYTDDYKINVGITDQCNSGVLNLVNISINKQNLAERVGMTKFGLFSDISSEEIVNAVNQGLKQ